MQNKTHNLNIKGNVNFKDELGKKKDAKKVIKHL